MQVTCIETGLYGCQNNFNVSGCSTLFLSACRALKAWFESSRINLYGSDLKGNKNYFELAGGSSYRGYNNSKYMKGNQSRGNRFWLELARGSS